MPHNTPVCPALLLAIRLRVRRDNMQELLGDEFQKRLEQEKSHRGSTTTPAMLFRPHIAR
jgi:hypothetical protein